MSAWLKILCLTFVCALLGASPVFAKGDTVKKARNSTTAKSWPLMTWCIRLSACL